jgi:hypothetical protein
MNGAILLTLCVVSSLGCLAAAEPTAEIQRGGLIYVLQQAKSNFYKVGLTSGTVGQRIKQLQTGNPQQIKEVFSQNVKDVGKAEGAAHRAVKQYHAKETHGGGVEWYEVPKPQVKNFINSIKVAISKYRSEEKMTLLQQVIAQMLN